MKKLLVIEGSIDEIDLSSRAVYVKRKDDRTLIHYRDTDLIYLVDYGSNYREEIGFSDLRRGDHLSYSPAESYFDEPLVSPSYWVIQR